MVVLYILLAIILLIVAVLSIRVTVKADFEQKFEAELRYLFLKIPLYPRPQKEKAPKKEKKPKEPKAEEEEQKPKKEKKKSDKPNPIITFIKNQGFDGVLNLISDIGSILTGMFGSIFRHVVFNKLYLNMVVAKNDAAATAIEYGKTCERVFPVMGYICSHMKVQKYDVEVTPDFLGYRNEAEFHVQISFRPIFLTNAAIAMVFKLLFKVGSKVLLSLFKKSNEHKNNKIEQGGALQ